MTKKVIKYTKTSEGTAPVYLYEGGWYPSSPYAEDMEMLGISKHDAVLPADVVVYDTKEELLNYLSTLSLPTGDRCPTAEQIADELFFLTTIGGNE